ncbi:MAG TPA: DMT family transporter [Gemmatimonadaceae bacterium]|jgi:inner membrane transporter RhtA|nr:DMT family transporter [Gemmatimonadaceae bacterium]
MFSTRVALPPVPAVLLAMFSIVGGAAIAKGLFPALGAAGTAGIRIGLSAVILLAVFRPPLARLSAAQWRAVVPYGMVLGLMNLLFYFAIARIQLGLAVTLEFIGPLGVAVLGTRRAVDVAWVALAAAGIALIAPWSGRGLDPAGVLLALLAGACWAAYIVLGQRASRVLAGGTAVATGMTVAALTVVPIVLAMDGFATLTPRLLAMGAVVALLSSAIPYSLEMIALRALPARTFGILMSLEPAAAALCGLIFLGEHLTGAQWLAVGLVIAASAGATVSARDIPAPIEV